MGLHDTSMTTADSNETDIDARDRRWMRRALELARLAESEDGEVPVGAVLVLDGEVTVETIVVSRTQPITMTVLGPGSLIGEMGLLDGAPRSASCTAMSELRCAVLTRDALNELLHDDPRTCAKLVLAIGARIAERMRDNQEKLKLYAQLTQAMNEEISELMPL